MRSETSSEIRRILCRRCAGAGIPISGTFELTPRCNLQCKMCYVRLTPAQMAPLGQELTAPQWLELAQQAKNAGLLFLLLTGGEPTLRPDFPEIYESLAQMGFSLSVNTNGTLLTPALRELWHRLPPAWVSITLYGSCREDYANLCGDGSAFDRVVEALHWLKNEGILIHLNTTMTPSNAHHWEQLEVFARNMGLDLRMTTYCFPPARREEGAGCHDFARLSPEEAASLLIKDMLYREGAEAVRRAAAELFAPPHAECDLGVGESISCAAGRSQFWVAWNGKMSPCGMFSHPFTYPAAQGFSPAWQELRQKTDEIRLCPECVACEERLTCMNCAAVTSAETGSFSGKPEYMCQMNRAYRQQLTAFVKTPNDP